MKFQIKHESKGRVRLRAMQNRMSIEQADVLESWLLTLPGVDQVSVHERICGVTIAFHGDRAELYRKLAAFSYETAAQPSRKDSFSTRAMNREYKEKLISQVITHFLRVAFLPDPLRILISSCQVLPRIWKAAQTLLPVFIQFYFPFC